MIGYLDMTQESVIAWPLAMLLLVAGVAGLIWGGNLLIDGAVAIVRRLGMPSLLIGLTIVAFGTSAPELALNTIAAANGETGLAFGNVIGSNIANIGLVLGLTACVAAIPMAPKLFLPGEFPWLLIVTLIAIALPWIGSGVDGGPGYARWAGLVLLGLAPVTAWLWYRDSQKCSETSSTAEQEVESLPSRGLGMAWLLLIGGLILLISGGKATEVGAVSLARWIGISEAVIGLSIVALATSLPEVVTALVAVRRGEPDLAIGTVMGSNVFNLALVLGTTSIISPVAIPSQNGWIDLAVMGSMTVAVMFMAMIRKRLSRIEGIILLLAWSATIVMGFVRELG
ncbi:MAG: calcium/sodium antiporter [Phycisphaerae bacterium]|nr:calcium/sodium antiporter [Phycisphaerae bacterium]|tara:strand:+ start:6634 stop:7656 length:1023 start_codon:yes stop_codon:yes gene_type:complete